MKISDLFSKEDWQSNTAKIVLTKDEFKTAIAVAMHETPWYLQMIGFPKWRVKEKYWTGTPAIATHDRWKWGYYTDINDYARKHRK